MANTTTVSGSTIQISALDGSTDWTWSSDLDSGLVAAGHILVRSVQVIPGATDDRIIMHDVGIDSAPLLDTGPMRDAYDARIIDFNPPRWCRPVLDISDCTVSAGTRANVRILINLA